MKRGGVEVQVKTPRFTSVFGVDGTGGFRRGFRGGEEGDVDEQRLVNSTSGKEVEKGRYRIPPRPIPGCLNLLKTVTERVTGEKFNICLVNYYKDGGDGISYHSDDEAFLGREPVIASFSLGARRDFLLKHKPRRNGEGKEVAVGDVVKLVLGSGDMVLMRGKTQSCWMHSIPKRKGEQAGRGRINITFRRAMVRAGTDNYYRYNVGEGGVFVWDGVRKEMVEWKGEKMEMEMEKTENKVNVEKESSETTEAKEGQKEMTEKKVGRGEESSG